MAVTTGTNSHTFWLDANGEQIPPQVECEGSSLPREARRADGPEVFIPHDAEKPGLGWFDLGLVGEKPVKDPALVLVDGARQDAYGEPVEHMTRVAQVWSVILSCDVTPRKVALAMAALKLVRESYKHDADNTLDLRGYAHIVDRCAEAEGAT